SAIPGKRRRRGRREARRMRDGRYTARHAIRRLPITQTVGGLGTGAAPASLCRVTTAPRLWSLQRPVPYPPRRGAAQPGDTPAPRLGYQPVVAKHRLPPSVRKELPAQSRRAHDVARFTRFSKAIETALIDNNLARISGAKSIWPCRSIDSIKIGSRAFRRLPHTRSAASQSTIS